VGLTASQYYSNASYASTLITTISEAFISPPVSPNQIINLNVVNVNSRRRQLQDSGASICASYEVSVYSQYSLGSYSTQIDSSVASGSFTTNLQTNAAATPGATMFITAIATSATVGKFVKSHEIFNIFNTL